MLIVVPLSASAPLRTTRFPITLSEIIFGAGAGVVSICGPVWVRPESERSAALPAPSVTVAELRLTAVAARRAVFWPAPTGMAEGERIAVGATGVGGDAAIVEGQRRRAAGN